MSFSSFIENLLPPPRLKKDLYLGFKDNIDGYKNLFLNKEWDILEIKIDKCTDMDKIFLMHSMMRDKKTTLSLINEWRIVRPKSLYVHIMSANYFIEMAWEHRGSYTAENVDKDAWLPFYQNLDKSYASIQEAIRINPDEKSIYSILATLGMANPELISIYEVIDRLSSLDNHYYYAQKRITYALSSRWQGGENEALDYVYNICNQVEESSMIHGLIPNVHIERWVDADNLENYFEQDYVRRDLLTSYEKCFPKKQFASDSISINVLNDFACCFYIAEFKEQAREILLFLSGRSDKIPWLYLYNTWFYYEDDNYKYTKVHKDLGII